MTDLTFPDEIVTKALVRYIDLGELGVGTGLFALITLDNGRDHSRPSTFGPAGLASLAAAVNEIRGRESVVGVGVTGKPFVFAAGADLTGIGQLRTAQDALAIAQAGHRTFALLRDLEVPTFAFLNGAAVGGGLELALHCDYRTLSRSAGMLAFPEVFLGLVPGWGGTQLLPTLVGPETAVDVIVANALNNNAPWKPEQAYAAGFADALLDSADFLVESLRWAARAITGRWTRTPRSVADSATWDAAIARGHAIADARVHRSVAAPYRALDLVAISRTADFQAGTSAENSALVELIMTEEFRSSVYAFDLVNRRAKRPTGSPNRSLARPVTKVGIIGAGLMASQLALLFVQRLKVPVVLTDVDPDRLEAGVDMVISQLDTLLHKGKLSPEASFRLRGLVSGSTDLAAFADADFVIEAVFEDLAVKQQVFADVERHVSSTAVLATNTSSLSVALIGATLDHPERLVGLHFFNPVAVLPLVEVVRTPSSDDAAVATAFAVASALGKSAVGVADAPAFVVNRLLTRFLGTVFAAVDAGTPIDVAETALDPLGLPMTPFELLGLVGPSIALHVAESLQASLGERFTVSPNLRRLAESGRRGIYLGSGGDRRLDPAIATLLEVGDSPVAGAELREAALTALAEEIGLMLDEGVISEVSDIDLCLLLGAGWPFHLGGIAPYLDRAGIAERVTGARFLPRGLASLPL